MAALNFTFARQYANAAGTHDAIGPYSANQNCDELTLVPGVISGKKYDREVSP
jgi:hypothetical protein